MTLNRAWFNALVDDNGTNTVGTVWNKTQIDGLLNTIDQVHQNTCKLSNSIAQPWGSGAWASMGWGTEHFDPNPMHNGNETVIYLQGPAFYYVDAQCIWPESTAGYRGMGFLLDAAVLGPPGYQFVPPFASGLGVGVTHRLTTLVQATTLHTLELQLYQNSGVSQTLAIGTVCINVFRIS